MSIALAAQEKAEELSKKAEVRRAQRDDDLREVMRTRAGRRFLWDTIERVCAVHSGTFADQHAVASYAEGRRAVGLELMQAAQMVDRGAYFLMLREYLEDLELELSNPSA